MLYNDGVWSASGARINDLRVTTTLQVLHQVREEFKILQVDWHGSTYWQ